MSKTNATHESEKTHIIIEVVEMDNDTVKQTIAGIANDFIAQRKIKICDFCSLENPEFSYDATDALLPRPADMPDFIPDQLAEGGWAACRECHTLIEAGDRAGLIKRGVDMFYQLYPMFADRRNELERETEIYVSAAHETFWRNRK